ncbi:MAG: thioredoxin [Candidatus Altiarchaeota archaeon]
MSDNVLEISDKSFDEVVKLNPLVVIDCWAEWCGPCKAIAPVLEELAEEFAGQITFTKLNIDENKEKAIEHGIMSIPTLLIFKEGKKVDQIVGAIPKDSIKEKLQKHL